MLSLFSHVQFFAIPWTVAHQAPLSTGFCRQGYWIGLPSPPPGDLPNPGIETEALTSPVLICGFFTTSSTEKSSGNSIQCCVMIHKITSISLVNIS